MADVFFVSERLYPDGNAGGIHTLHLARAIASNGKRAIVIAINNDVCCVHEKIVDKYSIVFYPVRSSLSLFRHGKLMSYWRRIFSGFKSAKKLASLLKGDVAVKKKHVLIYSYNLFFILPVVLVAKYYGLTICYNIVEKLDYDSYNFGKINLRSNLLKITNDFVFKKSKCLLCINNNLMDYYKIFGRTKKIGAIPSLNKAIDLLEAEDLVSNRMKKGRINYYYAGDPDKKDNIIVMIAAFKAFAKVHSDVHFHIFGLPKKVRDSVLEMTTDEKITIYKFMEHNFLVDSIKAMDYIFFVRIKKESNFFNFPTKVVEALSFAIPVVCNPFGAIEHYIDDGYGAILFDEESVSSAQNALERSYRLYYSDYQSLSRDALSLSKNKFSYSSYSDVIESLF